MSALPKLWLYDAASNHYLMRQNQCRGDDKISSGPPILKQDIERPQALLLRKNPSGLYLASRRQLHGNHAEQVFLPGEAARRLAEYGPNEFAEQKRLRPLYILLSKFRSPLLIFYGRRGLVSGVLGSCV